MCSQHYSKVAEHLSTLLLLDTEDRMDILMKRSRARAMMESWEDALRDADEVYCVISSCHKIVHDKVCRRSNSTRHLIRPMSGGMPFYMPRDVMQKPSKPLIQCYQY